MSGLLHVTFCGGRICVEVPEDQLFRHVRAPFEEPLAYRFSSVEIFGLHNVWCANLTALTRVRTEWVNDAISTIGMLVLLSTRWNSGGGCGARSIQGPNRGRTGRSGAAHTEFGMGRVHKSVLGSL